MTDMRTLCSKSPLPRCFKSHPKGKGIVLEADIRITDGKLSAKLLIFDTCKSLQKFWKEAVHSQPLGRTCKGAVNGLCHEWIVSDGTSYLEVDPRYYCIIGLTKNNLSMDVICHESVHVAYAFQKRVKRTPWQDHSSSYAEEELAYPAGRIASKINSILWDNNIYKTK